jgi:hypothetical protein
VAGSALKSHLAGQVNQSKETAIALASDNTGNNLCALFGNGRVSCAQGFNSEPLASFALPQGEALVEIALGTAHPCGVRADRTVLCVPFGCSDCSVEIAPPPGFKAAP